MGIVHYDNPKRLYLFLSQIRKHGEGYIYRSHINWEGSGFNKKLCIRCILRHCFIPTAKKCSSETIQPHQRILINYNKISYSDNITIIYKLFPESLSHFSLSYKDVFFHSAFSGRYQKWQRPLWDYWGLSCQTKNFVFPLRAI